MATRLDNREFRVGFLAGQEIFLLCIKSRGRGMKLTTHSLSVMRSGMMDLCLHSLMHLHGMVLK
jgi:hypothetical protein